MDKLKKQRTTTRTSFTKVCNALRDLIIKEQLDLDEIVVTFEVLEEKHEELCELDRLTYDFLLEADCDEAGLQTEVDTRDEYRKNFRRMKVKVDKLLKPPPQQSNASDDLSIQDNSGKRRFKLPAIELKKFGDDVKEWLSFWGQFDKIHNDVDIVDADKFQYLVQATVPGSRARTLVESFPPTGENYKKAIESLKARFGRDDLLVEVYVRELLKLILQNMNKKVSMSVLYDKLEAQLRALESLSVTSEKYAAMLYPLVESCLPEDILRVWQRSSDCDRDSDLEKQLKGLMNFLRKEVESEERISLAVAGFGMRNDTTFTPKKSVFQGKGLPTAAGLLNYNDSMLCVFCEEMHKAEECPKASKLSMKTKQKLLAKHKLCFLCLKAGHISRRCRYNNKCLLCGGKHVLVMCQKLEDQQAIEKDNSAKDSKERETIPVENALTNSSNTEVMLQTLKVWVRGDNVGCYARVLIDTGSQRSYVTETLVKQMGYVTLGQERMVHALFGGNESDPIVHNRYRVRLKNIYNTFSCNFEALDQLIICGTISPVSRGPWVYELKDNGIELSDDKNGPIEILIGADVAGKLLTGKQYILNCGMVAVETSLGWTLLGKSPLSRTNNSTNMIVTNLICKDVQITDLWALDVLDIQDPIEKKNREQLELAAWDHFNRTVRVNEEGRYEVQMPWLEDHVPLPSNYILARRRLDVTIKKLQRDGYYDKYNEVLKQWENENIIEQISNGQENEGHYLPHRAVIKENSTTPVRPVFDASAKEKGSPSLNCCVEKGVNLIELIPSILFRFRLEKIGVSADIRKAFLQICVQEKDRNFLKFLWIDKAGNLKTYHHNRVVFGVSSSPFLLGAVIRNHLTRALRSVDYGESNYSRITVEKLMKCFYVDNCLTSVSNMVQLNKFINESVDIFSKAKFCLRKWEYTDPELPEETEVTSILGLSWCKKTDLLSLSLNCFQELYPDIVTKRTILAAAHRIYDPIGFTCPSTLCPKILLKEAWALKIGWDVEVDEDIKKKFLQWLQDSHYLAEIKIPRWLYGNKTEKEYWSFHTFCDASKIAYATVVFLRIVSESSITVQLVQAKSRVAPNKAATIPRLELLAALIGARLTRSIVDCCNREIECYFWSDSSTVITWIQRADQWAVFVRNRVDEIHRLTTPTSWRHVPGHLNPADLPSRGCSSKALLESKFWEGPSWLRSPVEDWPVFNFTCNEDEINQEKLKGICSLFNKEEKREDDWYYRYFSKFGQICRLIGWIKRFIWNCQHKLEEQRREQDLTYQEVLNSLENVIILVQEEAFDGEKDKSILSLRPFTDDRGLLRVKTRLTERKDCQKFKYPIILPGTHPVVKRLIYEKHTSLCHAGIQALLSILREEYWIIKARKSVRSVIKKCVTCRRYESRLLETAPVSLPENRVRDAAVFEVTGIDMAGPVYLRDGSKAWICLFTCGIYRAVHLELVTSMSSSDFLQALRRFIARRGRPSVIYSDNGTNFTGTENAFQKLNWDKILNKCCSWRIEWKFNPPGAPWWGGWWERLVGLTKQLLRKSLGHASLNYEELQTILCDCEMVINSRPLTYMSEDIDDMIPITPSCFLQDIRNGSIPDCDVVDSQALEESVRYRQKVSEDLRKRFRSEYLGQLIQVSKKRHKTEYLKRGNVVLIASDNTKRLDWPLGIVQDLLPGKDGEVRLVRVQTSNGTMLRPIQKLCLLEMTPWESEIFLKNDVAKLKKAKMKMTHHELKNEGVLDEPNREVQVTKKGREVKIPKRYL